jgi:hypothetical protein
MGKITGGKRLAKMLEDGKVTKPYQWVDAYNQSVSDIAGTITCGIDFRCQHFITVEYEEDNSSEGSRT